MSAAKDPKNKAAGSASPALIQIRVERLTQLFDALDPLPLTERDLSKTAEDFIVGWARELPRNRPIEIIVHAQLDGAVSDEIVRALSNYFRSRAAHLTSDLKELFRIGRTSLAIGVTVLALCVIVGRWLSGFASDNYVARFFNEGLILVGWVANWKPIEVLLYDWWPIVRQRSLYQRLAAAAISFSDTRSGLAPGTSIEAR